MKKHASGSASVLTLLAILVSWLPTAAHSATTQSPTETLHLTGESPCGKFGFSLSSAGDFNGDGYEDMIVGAPFLTFGPGRAYIYFGGPRADSVADLTLEGPSSTAHFSMRVSSAGDFNGDGVGDVVVSVGNPLGSFYVYYGGRVPDSNSDLTLLSPPSVYEPGGVASGDVNGDGYTDLVVGFEGFGSPSRVFVYFGGPGVDASRDLELTASPNDLFGSEIATADFNGDGASDVIVGSASGIRVYYGGTGLDSTEDLRLTGTTIDGEYPSAFATAGDVNGDSSTDVMVATSDGEGTHGRVQIYFGGFGADSIPDITLHGDGPAASFISAMTSIGDVNADGFGDVLVGAVHADGSGIGMVYLFLGGSPMDSTPDTVVSNTTPMAGFALALAAADMNGDGVADGLVPRIGNCSVPGEGPPGEVSVYDFSTPLQSRAFVHGKNRTIALAKDASPVCIRFEPVGGSYDNADVDMSTLRLLSDDNEGISAMTPDAAKRMIVGDTDGNGIAELPTWFARSDLGSLFGSISGRGAVNARLEGQLNSHRRFLAPISLTIIGKPNTEHDAAASVFPNPLNPLGTLKFTTTKTGSVSVRVFDVGGRLVRALLASQPLAAGEHTVLFDGKDTQGTPLATGIYFYSIETSEGERRGRFVIAK